MEGIDPSSAGAWADALVAAPALARRRVRTVLRRAGWRSAPRRGWVAGIAPMLVASAEPAAGRATIARGSDWLTESVTLTDTFVVVAVVRCDTDGRRRVLKMPCTAEGVDALQRQAEVLAALHRDPRLAGWLDVVPRQRAYGEFGGRRYWVEDAVRGDAVSGAALRSAEGGTVLAAAIGLIEDLHARTGQERTVDAATVAQWVDRPLSRLRAFYAARPRLGDGHLPALRELGGELSDALIGRRLRTCWIHGDFWPGNLLTSGAAVTGVVDWDQAGPDQLALHDLLHVSVFARLARDGRTLGDVVVGSLRDGVPDATGVPAERVDAWLGGLPRRAAVLLYWLRHVSLFIASEGHGDNRDWVRRNVHNVLVHC